DDAEAKTAYASLDEAIRRLESHSTLQESSADIKQLVKDVHKLKTSKQISETCAFTIEFFINSLKHEGFEDKDGTELNFASIRKFICDEIRRQIKLELSGGDAGRFPNPTVCPLGANAIRCLLWNAGSNCLKQLNDALRLRGLIEAIKPDILLLNEITLTQKNLKSFILKIEGLGYTDVSITRSYIPHKVRTQRGSAILIKQNGWVKGTEEVHGSPNKPYEIAYAFREKPACHLLCCYIASGAEKPVIEEAQTAMLNEVKGKHKCIIAGDLNCEGSQLDILKNAKFIPLLDPECYTNWASSAKKPRQIDHVFVRGDILKNIRVHEPIEPSVKEKSGHRPILFDIHEWDQTGSHSCKDQQAAIATN
ncbi:hypothetical protein PFISCL1PPCAC_16868, partial [Pristionchus fissidentatus]